MEHQKIPQEVKEYKGIPNVRKYSDNVNRLLERAKLEEKKRQNNATKK